jgi:polygalacturonase
MILAPPSHPAGTVGAVEGSLSSSLVTIDASPDLERQPALVFEVSPTPTARALAVLPTPVVPARVFNVDDYGARGDGRADDTRAVQAAIRAAARAGGGTVHLPSGTYRISHLRLAAAVTLRGAGVTSTTIQAIGKSGVPTVAAHGVANIGLSNLKIEGRGVAGGGGDEILVKLVDAANVRVSKIHINRAQGIGMQVEGAESARGVYDRIRISNTFIRGNGFHGVALWFFAGPHHNQVSNLITDTSDGPGLMLDAGTTVGSGTGVSDNTLTNIIILRAARLPGAAGVILAGASHNTIDGFRIADTFAQDAVGLSIQQDQTGVAAEHNLITNGIISDVGNAALDLESASHNQIADITVRNIGRVGSARLIQLTSTTVNAGQTSAPTIGNTFSRITVVQAVGRYFYGLRLDSAVTPVLRNRFIDIAWGSPSQGIVESIGANAPMVGIDANVLESAHP